MNEIDFADCPNTCTNQEGPTHLDVSRLGKITWGKPNESMQLFTQQNNQEFLGRTKLGRI